MALSRIRLRAARLATRGSRDRAILDLLLELGDLPAGWHQQEEWRYRVGFSSGDRAKRARQQKLVGGARLFVEPEALLRVVAAATPVASDEDAQAQLAEGHGPQFGSLALNRQITEVTEVPPPPGAGEHARAFLTTITRTGGAPRRSLSVAWVESGQPILLGIIVRAPAVLDVSDLTSMLVQRQRQRLAQAARPLVQD